MPPSPSSVLEATPLQLEFCDGDALVLLLLTAATRTAPPAAAEVERGFALVVARMRHARRVERHIRSARVWGATNVSRGIGFVFRLNE